MRIDGFETADSADEARGLVFVADRSANEIAVVDPRSQAILAATPTAARPDYVRYVAATGELWITEPAADPPGIEIMRLGPRGEPPRRAGFITTEDGPEGLTLDRQGRRAYAHAFGGEVIVLDTRRRRELARWPIGCEEAHGFPRLDAADRLLLASCAAGGEGTLLDAASGELIDRHTTGGGESLPAYSPRTDHFYVRSDPGGTLTNASRIPAGAARCRPGLSAPRRPLPDHRWRPPLLDLRHRGGRDSAVHRQGSPWPRRSRRRASRGGIQDAIAGRPGLSLGLPLRLGGEVARSRSRCPPRTRCESLDGMSPARLLWPPSGRVRAEGVRYF